MAEAKVKILVVDDEPSVLESFKMILEIKDYEVVAVPDGPTAVEELKKSRFDMAFIDMRLSGMDGLEVLKKAKQLDPDMEVVIVTAYASDETHANAITFGAMEYLRKPFLMEVIYELVERALRRRREKSRKKAEPS